MTISETVPINITSFRFWSLSYKNEFCGVITHTNVTKSQILIVNIFFFSNVFALRAINNYIIAFLSDFTENLFKIPIIKEKFKILNGEVLSQGKSNN